MQCFASGSTGLSEVLNIAISVIICEWLAIAFLVLQIITDADYR